MLAPNIIIIWTGTNAGIPSNFARETRLDGLFPKGIPDSVTNPNVSAGANTHSHTSPAHSHAVAAHTHTYDLDYTGTSNTDDMSNGGGHIINPANHAHFGNTTTSMSAGSSSSDSLTYASGNSLPPYYSVIFIKALATIQYPVNTIALWNISSPPTGWALCDGTLATPDLRNKYLRGAATGADAGVTGGSYNHTHDISHTHASGASHGHTGGAGHGTSGGNDRDSGSGADVDDRHGHNVTLNAIVAPIAANSDVVSLGDNVEPLYKKLLAIQNQNTNPSIYPGCIALWLGALNTIPSGWFLCDGTNGTPDMRAYHLKIANDATQLATTGGSNTHTHAATNHSHASGGTHVHGGSSDGHPQTQGIDGTGSNATARNIGAHNLINCSTASPVYGAVPTTADSSNNEPAYLTAAYIQYAYDVSGAPLFAFL